MKEFEKFWNKYWLSYSSYVGSEQHLAKATWKAALEAVLLLNSVRVHDDVYEDIKKELKDAKT